MHLMEVRDACFAYDDRVIFEKVSLHAGRGQILCITGPNGCGKTTLLDCMLGVRKLRSGSILFAGKNINTMRVNDIAKHAAYVPQIHERTFPYKVLDIVLMGRACHMRMFSSPSASDRKIAEECLEMVGMADLKDRPYTQISGGESQLVMLARSLAQKTGLIVMDEPTAHLDFKNELIFLETMANMVKAEGLSVIMATHFPNHAFYFENNHIDTSVALMSNRGISLIGPPGSVLHEDSLESVYGIRTRIISCPVEGGRELRQIIPISTKNSRHDAEGYYGR